MSSFRYCCMLHTLAVLPWASAEAQTVTQEFELVEGWNAVFIDVDPQPATINNALAELPIASVWTPQVDEHHVAMPECNDAEDPADCLKVRGQSWQMWFPPDRPHHIVTTLHKFLGGRSYLVQATAPATLTIHGAPSSSRTRWREGFNFVGFRVVDDPLRAPSFGRYFEGSPAHDHTSVYEVKPDGQLSLIVDLNGTRIRPGRGYWVHSNEASSSYDGPLFIDNQTLRGVEFAPGLSEHSIRLENLTSTTQHIEVAAVLESTVTDGDQRHEQASDTSPLLWFNHESLVPATADETPWQPLTSQSISIGPKGSSQAKRVLRIAPNSLVLTQSGDRAAQDQETDVQKGMLKITSSAGYEQFVPWAFTSSNEDGLWVGMVTVNQVSYLDNSIPQPPSPTSSEFSFRIIIHKSDSNEYTLLTEVALIPSASELATPRCLDSYTTNEIVPRVSTAAFSFDGGEWPLVGGFGLIDETLETAPDNPVLIPAHHPLNPFKHTYHPDHRCDGECLGGNDPGTFCVQDADCDGGTCLAPKVCVGGSNPGQSCTDNNDCGTGGVCELVDGCIEINRQIVLDVTQDSTTNPEWGGTRLAGTYAETIVGGGVHREQIDVSGVFDLRRVSDIPKLCNDQ